MTKIAFIKAGWHADIVDQSLVGFQAELQEQGSNANVAVFTVPGAFEMPLLAHKLAKTDAYDAIIAAAFVVDGGIYRHEFVAQAVVTGLMQAQLQTGLPIISVSLTPKDFQPTDTHEQFFRDHFIQKGREAAQAALQILTVDAA